MGDELLVTDVNENQLVEFWEDLDDFPYDNGSGEADPETEEGRKQFIYDLILRISKTPDMNFGSKVPAKCVWSHCVCYLFWI